MMLREKIDSGKWTLGLLLHGVNRSKVYDEPFSRENSNG